MSVHETPRSLKRDHDAFTDRPDVQQILPNPTNFLEQLKKEEDKSDANKISASSEIIQPSQPQREPSPARSTTESLLSDVGPFTPSDVANSPMISAVATTTSNTASPSAFAALNGNPPPPSKKVKMTFAEKEEKRILKEIKEAERAADKAKKEAEKMADKVQKEAEKAAEKAQKEAEKEADRRKKEVEREEKRAAQEAEKAAKEEKRRKKEEEKQKVEEEKKKKERSQKKLNSFFSIPSTAAKGRRGSVDSKERGSASPAPENSNLGLPTAVATTTAAVTPKKPERSCYEKTFPDFFVHNDVKLAKCSKFERDGDAIEALEKTLDGYLDGSRSPDRTKPRPFDANDLFHLSGQDVQRGKHCMPVRDIMAEFFGIASKPIDLTTDSQNSQIKRRGDLLRRVPLKLLSFAEDVRPPYRGTYTSRPVNGMTKLARNPLRRDLPDTNYDYDSEAEWVEDDDAEDCNSDRDEEEGDEDAEDMDGFLDDENDDLANAKRAIIPGNDLEPVSTGLCWEDKHKRNTNVKMLPYRMEIIIDPKLKSIDPFSTFYWAPNPPLQTTTMDPPRIPLTTIKPNASTLPCPPKPFFAPASSTPSSSLPQTSKLPPGRPKLPKLLPADDIPKFRQAVQGSNLSKVGLIEVLKKQFPGRQAAAIKGTLEVVARRVGVKEKDKRWVVVGDVE
ncbi:hypothetical protein GLAREA_06482 [Glarea lozoyensis ATCC 20868]|uniref:Chromatin assembly factor 1 subunit rlf2 n=1 Tax=Glarea lozoyensis (strain ATCC 20868 / MF5171) TaxID=1116229 RepID=S3D8I4_GLAL2|nr:uncharacterized protein GLAREA_06482 [Glarea lozoyensis ATCC 20868]EPE33469.1 hypothetical protein GLAREA_06482 [Glarea lozoyensis ATCC 20868]